MAQDIKKNQPREAALDILLDMDRTGRRSSAALEDGLRKLQFIEKESRAFITRLVEGTTEYRLQIDFILDHYGKKPVLKQKPPVRAVLRMSVYQLLYMNSVPDRAVLSEAGRLMRKYRLEGMTGVVNGILRNVQRGIGDGTIEKLKNSSMSVRYSVPSWIIERLNMAYGEETTERILRSSFLERPLTIRVNTAKTDIYSFCTRLVEAGIKAEEGIYAKRALRLQNVDFVRRLPGFREGYFFVQDESSQLAMEALGEVKGKKIVSFCAAPGGKATYLAERGAVVTARDISEDKTGLIRENAERLGLNLIIQERDASKIYEDDKEAFDVVVADVPCSGLGVMGRKNDIKYHVTPEGVEELTALGSKILDAAALAVKPGGILLFSTCTLLPEENKEQKTAFLIRHPEFEVKAERQLLQGVDECDGFYFCMMTKQQGRF